MGYSNKIKHILKTMYKNDSINKNQIPPDTLHNLFQDHYITNSTDFHDKNVYLTTEGKAYVEEIKLETKRIVHDWINTGIAVSSLIVAIISLIVSLMPQ